MDPDTIQHVLEQFGTHDLLVVGSVYVIIAGIRHLPPPLEGQRWYGWVYDTLQAVIPFIPSILERRPAKKVGKTETPPMVFPK